MFRTYRRIKRISKHLIGGSSLVSAPVIVAGVCGVIGLAALVYFKKKADNGSLGSLCGCRGGKCFAKAKSTKHRTENKKAEDVVFGEEDFIVSDVNEDTASKKKTEEKKDGSDTDSEAAGEWVASSTSKTFHRLDCSRVNRISKANRIELKGSKEELVARGYKPCAYCIK